MDPRIISYMKGRRNADLRVVASYVASQEILRHQFYMDDPCFAPDSEGYTKSIYATDTIMRISIVDAYNFWRCPAKKQEQSEVLQECTANISDLDENIDASPSLPAAGPESIGLVRINCLSGECAACKEQIRYWDKRLGWVNRTKENHRDGLVVHIGDPRRFERQKVMLNGFLRALSRIISGGSDEQFCKQNIGRCEQ